MNSKYFTFTAFTDLGEPSRHQKFERLLIAWEHWTVQLGSHMCDISQKWFWSGVIPNSRYARNVHFPGSLFSKKNINYFIPVWINNLMPIEMRYESTYPFLNFNGTSIEVWEWISNFLSHFILNVITHACWDQSYIILINGASGG